MRPSSTSRGPRKRDHRCLLCSGIRWLQPERTHRKRASSEHTSSFLGLNSAAFGSEIGRWTGGSQRNDQTYTDSRTLSNPGHQDLGGSQNYHRSDAIAPRFRIQRLQRHNRKKTDCSLRIHVASALLCPDTRVTLGCPGRQAPAPRFTFIACDCCCLADRLTDPSQPEGTTAALLAAMVP